MAVRGWGGSIAVAIGVAAGAGAAQLGLGYGLGIIAWLPTANEASEAAWVASLAWATWIAATSVVAGALAADRLSGGAERLGDPVRAAGRADAAGTPTGGAPAEPRPAGRGSAADDVAANRLAAVLWRLALAVAAAVGALVTVALVAVPARAAERADTFSPQTIAAGYAVIGVIVGLLVAIGAVTSRAVAANVLVTVAWLWLLAIVAVVDGVASGRGLASAQLGVWQMTDDSEGYWFRNMYLPGVALSLGSALIIGALAALPAARRGDGRVGVAVSGAVGPLLVAAAYFLAAPRLVGVRAEQLSAYLVAPYAVIAGLAGSVMISAVGAAQDRARIAALDRPRPADRTPAPGAHDDPTQPPHPVPSAGGSPARPGPVDGGQPGAGPAQPAATGPGARGKARVPSPRQRREDAGTDVTAPRPGP
jgi:hypothetical protein